LQVLFEECIGVLVHIDLRRLLCLCDRLGQLLASYMAEDIAFFVKVFFEGLIRAAAPIKPVSSSQASRTFSIVCSGLTSEHKPYA
jgi:hypothetical protein